ncbi:MAG: hypothetical protein H8K06_17320 [Nitrospira sp.]|uniref:Secreted protein n=1 Tax=Nitrospira defluvii TaxID=330214 RepID=A0ABM8QZI0_9BACT|nr:hypothetical protein [Nitrospira defluvii]MCS6328829.1 hypothetical protein [Nitrospira sp.]CAE6725045.1 conserved exported hypothetical protein [Nitrospira defluvii]
MRIWIISSILITALFLSTTSLHAALSDEPRNSDQGIVCKGLMPERLLCDLYSQALATLREHVEINGMLPGNGSTGPRKGEFRLKFFPHGKSRSQEHLSAEGSFNLSPESKEPELTLRFKSSKPRQPDASLNLDTI